VRITGKAAREIEALLDAQASPQRKRKAKAPQTSPALFVAACAAHGIQEPVPELCFAPPRRWRWDWAWPEAKLSLEVQGGLFVNGRHSRGAALLKEHEKLNAGARLGWRVLYCTPKDIKTGAIFGVIKEAIG
jgi:hypothetical protein